MESANQSCSIGLRRRLDTCCFEFRQHKRIDRIPNPFLPTHNRNVRPSRRCEGPVRGIIGAGRDPSFEQLFLVFGQATIRLRRRHEFIGIRRTNPGNHRTRVHVSRHNRTVTNRSLPIIDAQICLSLIAVLPMTVEAVLSQDWTDIAIEVDLFRLYVRTRNANAQQ